MTIFTRSQVKRRRYYQKESNQKDTAIGVAAINDSKGAGDQGLVDWSFKNIYGSNISSISLAEYCWEKRIIDKTIICKTLFGIDDKLVRVCVPKGYGKSYNLLVIREFFNVLTRHDIPELIETPYGISSGISDKYALDLTKARSTRTKRLANTLLHKELPGFFEKRFCQYPVILIRFDHVRGKSHKDYWNMFFNAFLHSTAFWVIGIDRKALHKRQLATITALEKIHHDLLKSLDIQKNFWEKHSELLITLFMDLLDLLVDIYKRRYIILIDNYDIPLVGISSEPHANATHKFYIEFLCQMLADNASLEKALLVGTYVLPLSTDNNRMFLDNVLTISHAAQQCTFAVDVGNAPITSYEAALESMFGIRKTEATNYIKNMTLYYPKIGKLIDDVVEKTLQYFRGYQCSFYETRCITNQLKAINWDSDYVKTDLTLWKDGKVPSIENNIRLIALKYHIDMVLLSSRLTCGYDFKQLCCYIWPSLEAVQ
ncbi:hypothetical protein COEREDRAFT_89665 [Coemansia reversa NRRL 1564]|uniref:AAA-ATPase-like domain-containing protein n=1 Tax=Coemansia reversa (strain ATCC 12441 / NRRL 1564) TaxID=763665 RepID=A0A2G5B2U0_COERN|nr:hypothetical protein COEREDRAFT_89665 [Coemansia reversa NRRL 1564]|eukprot:PIA13315.1 hypothetical protein COEREDRAFT_89665 [Coemansia reversa NRRL 1564]